jgi:Flp pilus assembly protein TadG
MKRLRYSQKKEERGQVLVVLALLFIALIAIIGLAIDMGYMYVNYARLRRAVDAAALSATSQFKEGYSTTDLTKAAQEFLRLNGVDHPTSVSIQTCDNTPGDTTLCTTPRRKLVRVRASEDVPLYFLSVIGFHSVPVSAEAISEAASVDVVFAIDISESMTFGDTANPITGSMRDPKTCNESDPGGADGYPGDCHPFQEVKDAAYQFIHQMYYPYDRVAIITFAQKAKRVMPLTENEGTIESTILHLNVYEGGDPANGIGTLCPYTANAGPASPISLGVPCRLLYNDGTYYGFDCPEYPFNLPTGDPSRCTTTNIGDGMKFAGNEFAMPPMREEALWVVILLTDGAANAAYDINGSPVCPSYTWSRNPYCRDMDATDAGRHTALQTTLYDADDYARDMIDFVANDQSALIFSVGLGSQVTDSRFGNPPAGQTLLQYAANEGLGEYYFAPTGSQLRAIFIAIANKIATRLTR